MHKSIIVLATVVIASLLIFEINTTNAANINQIDSLKAQFLPAEYRNKTLTIDDVKKVLRERCKKTTGIDNSTLYKEIEIGAGNLITCLSGIVNVTKIQEEMERARPLGDLDTVFNKYCTKAPDAEKCLTDFNAKLQPCFTVEERKQNAVMMRVITSLIGFMCSRGGDQIALFIAEEGPECLEANKEAIANCMNNSFHEYMPKDGTVPDLMNIQDIVLSPEHCIDFERFEKCTIHHLEQCNEITPANVAESVFKFIKNETSCKTWIDAKARERPVLKDPKSGAYTLHFSAITVFLGSIVSLIIRKV